MKAEAYTPIALEHFRSPRNVGAMKTPDAWGHSENPVSGAVLDLFFRVEDERIREVRFKAEGCAATIAAASVSTQLLVDRSIRSDRLISREEIEGALGGLPPTKRHASLLVVDAVASAVLGFSRSAAPEV